MENNIPKEESVEVKQKSEKPEEFYEDETQETDGGFEEYNNDEFRFGPARGAYRGGRGWGPPRFRGRGGFGMPPGPMGAQMGARGPRQPPPFFRGRGGGPAGNRFQGPGPNYDPAWGPPGMMNHLIGSSTSSGNFNATGPPHMQELWVETKTEEGKSYFYHAITRETTWTRPEGPHIKIMSQMDVEAMNKLQQQQQQQPQQQQQQPPQQQISDKPAEGPAPGQQPNETVDDAGKQVAPQNPTPNSEAPQQHNNTAEAPPLQQQFTGPPPGQQFQNMPQFGMPPPGFPGGFPTNHWNPAQNWQGMPMGNPGVPEPKDLMSHAKPGEIDPNIIAKAAEWTEHRAPDGRPYYYHAVRGESVWEKPQAIRDLEVARMAAFSNTTMPPMNAMPNPGQMPPMANLLAAQMSTIPPHVANNMALDPLGFVLKPQMGMEIDAEETGKNDKKRKQDAEKKKKDDDEEKAKLASKPLDKSRPISSTPISGTPWCVVWTGDGRVFFYNPSTRTSVWERPEELLERADVDKAVSTPPEQLVKPKEDEKPEEINNVEPKARSESESSATSEETPAKKLKLDTAAKPVEKKNDGGKEAVIEAEARAARERALVPLEIRVKSFKEMLKEKDVSAFSTWEKELHKIVFDPRYLLLTSRERKQVFEKYVKERAEEERREKRNKMKQKRDDFKSLLESANLHGKSSFNDFIQKFCRDERFKCIEKVRERESLFNEHILDIRKKEKEDKVNKKEKIKKEFLQLLREHHDIDRHSRWSDIKKKIDSDSRYKSVESSILREDYFHDYCKILKDEKKKSKDKKEKKKDKKSSSCKDDDKDDNKDGRDNKEEEDNGGGNTSEDEEERQRKERDRKLRAELSIKEREKEVQRTLASHLRDRDKEREHHKRDEAMRHFSALLADLVRNSDLTWKEVKKQLRKDHRWELVENLDRNDRERLFNEHIESLTKKKRDKFREMLEELNKIELQTSWKEIKKTVKDDPRYLKFNSSEKCEREYKEYIKDKLVMAKAAFRELLQECKLITHKSLESVRENQNHLREIEDILKNDKRYLVLDHLDHERTQIILAYLEELNKRGPPPPPTASESTRRK